MNGLGYLRFPQIRVEQSNHFLSEADHPRRCDVRPAPLPEAAEREVGSHAAMAMPEDSTGLSKRATLLEGPPLARSPSELLRPKSA
jgi:hypothetical protein